MQRPERGGSVVREGLDSETWPDVTVVLLIHHPGAHELRTAELVRQQRYPGRVTIHMIESTPGPPSEWSQALERAADRWRVIRQDTFGHGVTRNDAANDATTPIVAFLSQDAHPADRDWLRALVEPLMDGRAEASYGRQVAPTPDPERQATFAHLYPEKPQIKTKGRVRELGLTTFHFSDVTSAFATEVVQRVGFPDVSIFEDVAIAKRLLDAGCRIAYVPEALVYHAHRMGLREMIERYRQIGSVYERLGIFSEVRASGRSLLREGIATARGVTPGRPGRARPVRSFALGALKLASVSCGRWEARSRWVGGKG